MTVPFQSNLDVQVTYILQNKNHTKTIAFMLICHDAKNNLLTIHFKCEIKQDIINLMNFDYKTCIFSTERPMLCSEL